MKGESLLPFLPFFLEPVPLGGTALLVRPRALYQHHFLCIGKLGQLVNSVTIFRAQF